VSKKSLDVIFVEYLKEQVEDAKATYVGIQECEGMPYDLVLFNHPKTGSTLAVKSNVDDVRDAVAKRLAAHEKSWRKAKYLGSAITETTY
jgi:FKBP-type peptidyl-prolyl cis-trans isomerase 2